MIDGSGIAKKSMNESHLYTRLNTATTKAVHIQKNKQKNNNKKQHLSANLPLRLAIIVCAGYFIMSSYITVFKVLK